MFAESRIEWRFGIKSGFVHHFVYAQVGLQQKSFGFIDAIKINEITVIYNAPRV